MNVELYGLGACPVACVRDGNGERDATALSHLGLVGSSLAQLEGGVAQSVTKGEEWLFLLQTVGPAIAHEDIFLVFLVDNLLAFAPSAGIGLQRVGTTLFKICIPREGQLATWVHIAQQHIGQSVSGFRTDEPSLHDCRHLAKPRKGGTVAGNVHIDKAWVGSYECFHQAILRIRQVVLLAVDALAVLTPALVESTEHNHHIGLASLADGLTDEFVLRTLVAELVIANGDAVETLDGVTHIAAGIVDGELRIESGELRDEAVEGYYLALYLQRRRAAADGHHLDGILAHDQYLLTVREVEGQQRL